MSASTQAGLPDVLVIGDSHSNALVEGCLAHGLRVEMLRFSGNLWHAGRVVANREHGVWARGLRAMQGDILALRARLDGRRVLSPDIPVLGAFGFHLGRLVPMLGYLGHRAEPRRFLAEPEALFLSRGFVDAYVDAHRGHLLRLAQRMARECPLTIVVPPRAALLPNNAPVIAAIRGRLERAGVAVFDPAPEICGDGPLDPGHLLADGTHGNAAYGEAVVGLMLRKRILRPRGQG